MTKFSELATAVALTNSDIIAILQGSVVRGIEYSALRTAISSNSRWQVIPSADYDATPPQTYQINMSDSSGILEYYPVRVLQGGTYLYFYVTDVQAAYILLVGPRLATNVDVDSLEIGSPEISLQKDIDVAGTFNGGTTTTLLATTAKKARLWLESTAYLCQVAAFAKTTGSTGPYINILKNGDRVLLANSGDGVQVNGGYSGLGEIDKTYYRFEFNDVLEIEVTNVGVGTWGDLTASLVFIRE